MSDKEKFTFSEVLKHLNKLPEAETRKVVLVGGQALNFWADVYLHQEPISHPFASKDLDFLMSEASSMGEIAKAWNAKLLVNDDITSTHWGFTVIQDMQQEIKADFMSAVHGLQNKDIRKKHVTINFDNLALNIMHPIHCFKSRFENVVGLRRHNEHSVNQLRVAIKMINIRIQRIIDDNSRDAHKEINTIFKYLKRSKSKRQELYNLFQIDLFDSIPDDERLGENYIKKRYPQMKEFLKLKGQ
ncbi:hypothetical protein HON22_02370 [Candidatus Peregrinibacteria bacterium]|jgi:hypothetical protein|nr:hypothetical protein [Candidatus Peregrinibacteria bacterium]